MVLRIMIAAGVSAAIAIAAPSVSAQPRNVAPAISAKASDADTMPDRIVRFANGTTVSADIPYSTIVGFRPVTLDLYRPAASGPHPLVIYVHGGGWMIGNPRSMGAFSDWPSVLAGLSARGYVVAALEYRLAGEAPFPAAVDDVHTAIRFLRANAARFGIDAGKVAIWGGSAGSQIALLAALDCGRPPAGKDSSNPQESDCVQAAAGWYGVYDFATMRSAQGAVKAFLGCAGDGCTAETIAAASAIAHVDPKDPPLLLIHGTDDKTAPLAQSELLAERARAAKVPVTLEVIPGVGHGWVGADAAATRAASLHALDLTFRFFDSQLKQGR